MTRAQTISRLVKPSVFTVALIPFALAVWWTVTQQWGPNPAQALHRFTGDWAIRFLLLALAVTPLRQITGLTDLAKFRRMIGLFAFFYASVHLINYVALDKYFDWADIWADVLKRQFITVGFAAFLILVALALTSPTVMVKKLGGKCWQALHRLVYVAAIGGCLHFFMMVRGFQWEPVIYAGILAVLLGYRAHRRFYRPKAGRVPG